MPNKPAPSTLASELAKTFDPKSIEDYWYETWEKHGFFKDDLFPNHDAEAPTYCMQLPPPNVTGTLHMGHAFQQTLMDSLIRYHRMTGKKTNWVVGTDHAGIATQLVVERQLNATGRKRQDLGREKFLEEVWRWKQQSGSTITNQMRRLGSSANWEYADSDGNKSGYFTMDSHMSNAVIEVFVKMHEDGLIYKGNRLVNWDPKLQTAVSDLEVDNVEKNGKIWEIEYHNHDQTFSVIVATTRPETMLGDVAIAVNPSDDRYTSLVGKEVVIPLCGRTIPIIADEYVDASFGTGCVKITPAHDFNDFSVGERHRLAPINILNLDGTLNERTPERFQNIDRLQARKLILKELKDQGLLVGEKKHTLNVPTSGRTGEIVEPLLTDQWFVKTQGLADQALKAVRDKEVRFHPDHWTSTYNHWLENIQDWCISRQLWWGHQIPAWYDTEGNIYVARDEKEAREQAKAKGYSGPLRRDEDVLDTWFSSALVPFSSLGWPKDTKDLAEYLPSNVLVTGFDIIFFWVARMIMMTLHFTGKVPFKDVYINALVRDAEGQKMSKSKGNTIDPLDLLDGIDLESLVDKSTTGLLLADHQAKIEKYLRKNFPKGIPAFGADSLRFTFASLATFARTLNFDLNRCEGYRNFCNKLWNASRFVLMNTEGEDCGLEPHGPEVCASGQYLDFSASDRWISNEFERTIAIVHQGFSDYRLDSVASAIYQFVWDEFCDWYLEIAKVQIQMGNEGQRRATRRTLIRTLEKALRMAHPIIPFITEELWQKVAPVAGLPGNSVMVSAYPKSNSKSIDNQADEELKIVKNIVTACRTLKAEVGIGPSERLPLLMAGDVDFLTKWQEIIRTLSKSSEVIISEEQVSKGNGPKANIDGFSLMLHIEIDLEQERQKIENEMTRISSEIERDQAKLKNDNFVQKAPEQVVEKVRQLLASNLEQLLVLEGQLKKL
ncbi:MAG: valine--tRNA ligase [Betaproteobacteria bacterium]|nr:valine--tRNA ligase [Betaproteobacteria bacterium]